MKVTMLLADAAQAVGGKLYVLGGGWSQVGPDPAPMALAIKIEVPWDETNVRHTAALELVDADGVPVAVENPQGGNAPLRVEAQFEVGRPPGVKPGTPIDVPMALTFGAIPLPPNGRYEWRLSIDGRHEADWSVAFSTRPR
jgi:hypothetical protein